MPGSIMNGIMDQCPATVVPGGTDTGYTVKWSIGGSNS